MFNGLHKQINSDMKKNMYNVYINKIYLTQ